MNIILNGETFQCEDELTVQSLIEQQNLTGKRLAIEVNLEIVPRSQFKQYHFSDGDRVEVVHAIGGG